MNLRGAASHAIVIKENIVFGVVTRPIHPSQFTVVIVIIQAPRQRIAEFVKVVRFNRPPKRVKFRKNGRPQSIHGTYPVAALIVEKTIDDIGIAIPGVTGGLRDESMSVIGKIIRGRFHGTISANHSRQQTKRAICQRCVSVDHRVRGIAVNHKVSADRRRSGKANNLLRHEGENRVIDKNRAVACGVGHLQRQTVGVVDGGISGCLRGYAVAGKITGHDGVGHVSV